MAKTPIIENIKNSPVDRSIGFHIVIFLLVFLSLNAQASSNEDSLVSPPESEELEKKVSTQELADRPVWLEALIWPFSHIFQPILSAAVFPIVTPLRYAFSNRVVDKGINLASFGKEKNILIYPTFNLKPGSTTEMALIYRHRNLFFDLNYLVLSFSLYANGDWDSNVRYSKNNIFKTDFMSSSRIGIQRDRNSSFVIPNTTESFTQTDSSFYIESGLTHVLPHAKNWNASLSFNLRFANADLPDVYDSILTDHPSFYVRDRGVYQDFVEKRIHFSLQFDNTDAPFVPSKGSRVIWNIGYSWVSDYSNLHLDLPWRKEKSHDYYYTEFVYQHYFLLGKSVQYMLSMAEAREIRRKTTGFSWDDAVRLWNPEQMKELLLDRKVIALQFRFRNLTEVEEGGAPFSAIPNLNSRFPLRGYTTSLTAFSLMGLSFEYRWPIDRYIDGVFFNEYALFSDKFYNWKTKNLRNSWGFGVRVRSPDMFFFRTQIGFHGLHGIALVLTVSSEFM